MILISAYLGFFNTLQDLLRGYVRIPGMGGLLVCFRSSLRTPNEICGVIGFLSFSSGFK
jgi:hypothetical protein